MPTQDDRDQAWDDLFSALRRCRDFAIEDNGDTREQDPNDPWLAHLIGQLDVCIGHWDPDASEEETAYADARSRRPPPKRHRPYRHTPSPKAGL